MALPLIRPVHTSTSEPFVISARNVMTSPSRVAEYFPGAYPSFSQAEEWIIPFANESSVANCDPSGSFALSIAYTRPSRLTGAAAEAAVVVAGRALVSAGEQATAERDT